MTKEQHERRTFLPRLPIPYEGVADEIINEITLDDHQSKLKFSLKVVEKLPDENPNLTQLIGMCANESSVPNISLGITFGYYEIFSRSATRLGVPMLRVYLEAKRALLQEQSRIWSKAEKLETPEDLLIAQQQIMTNLESDVGQDRQKSPELDKYWKFVDKTKEVVRERFPWSQSSLVNTYRAKEFYLVFSPLYILHKSLKIQDEINQRSLINN